MSDRLHPLHQHVLRPYQLDNGWLCDASKFPVGCKRGITHFNQTRGILRYRCETCDFDLCDKCFASGFERYFHDHPLGRDFNDNGWACDGRNMPGGCRRGITGFRQTQGIPRYRCVPCDFDLCDKCFEVGGKPSEVKFGKGDFSHLLYCGRYISKAGLPGSDGFCGPSNGPQCKDCIKQQELLKNSKRYYHEHPLGIHFDDNGWACDGKNEQGGCKRGITGFHQTKGVPRYRCIPCDFDLCDKCFEVGGKPSVIKFGSGSCSHLLYCGRFFGQDLPGSDGYCGPSNGPQCSDCQIYQKKESIKVQPGNEPNPTGKEVLDECKICLDNMVNCVFVPCGHLACCVQCSVSVTSCPICRAHIGTRLKVFLT